MPIDMQGAMAGQESVPDSGRTVPFIDLFAGIGGLRLGFEQAAADVGLTPRCVFTSEWDSYCQRTYEARFHDPPKGDITIHKSEVPAQRVLLAGFPCQPFSIAGVSKKNALGRPHGFKCKEQGNLFFEIRDILKAHRPEAFLLENVKHLRRHDKGRTYAVILEVLRNELGYTVRDHVYDARAVVPQHRERIFILGFRDPDLAAKVEFTPIPDSGRRLGEILQPTVDPKYTLSAHLWRYLRAYKEKHQRHGNGFGFGLFGPEDVARTLSARYYKDGSEILIRQGRGKRPRRLTPRECARLMGYGDDFEIVVSDTRAYKQFGNSVVVPVVRHVGRILLQALVSGSAARPLRVAG